MQENKHRNYEYIPETSKQDQTATELLNQIRWFMRHAKLKPEDWKLLTKMMKNLQQIQSTKVLRSMQRKFTQIQQQYN